MIDMNDEQLRTLAGLQTFLLRHVKPGALSG